MRGAGGFGCGAMNFPNLISTDCYRFRNQPKRAKLPLPPPPHTPCPWLPLHRFSVLYLADEAHGPTSTLSPNNNEEEVLAWMQEPEPHATTPKSLLSYTLQSETVAKKGTATPARE